MAEPRRRGRHRLIVEQDRNVHAWEDEHGTLRVLWTTPRDLAAEKSYASSAAAKEDAEKAAREALERGEKEATTS